MNSEEMNHEVRSTGCPIIPWHRQFPRYVASGAMAGGSDLGTYALLAKVFGVHPLIANLVSRPLGGLVSFLLNRHWTFANHGKGQIHVHFLRYWVVWGMSFAISEAFVWLFHNILALGPLPTKLFAEGLTAVFTFLCHRHWTFT